MLEPLRDVFTREKRVRGIEPPYARWEGAVLPLNYTRKGFRFSIGQLGLARKIIARR